MDELRDLLSVKEDDVSGVLDILSADECVNKDSVKLTFHYIRFQNRLPRKDDFIQKLYSQIVPFCLKREKFYNLEPQDVWQLWREAKQKFARPKGGKTGEPGELIVFFLMEGYLYVPKIFSKMSLKTNSQMHIHGSDGVHLGIDGENIILHFGESKLYGVPTNGITAALDSVKDFVGSSGPMSTNQQDFEIQVLSDNLDIPEGPLSDLVLKVLDPYSKERSNLHYLYTCFIGFDLEELKDRCDLADFEMAYASKAKSCYENVLRKIQNDDVLKALNWQFFFIPFDSVSELRTDFLQGLQT